MLTSFVAIGQFIGYIFINFVDGVEFILVGDIFNICAFICVDGPPITSTYFEVILG